MGGLRIVQPTAPGNGLDQYYGASFDYTPTLLIEIMEAFYAWYDEKNKKQDNLESFWEVVGLDADVRTQLDPDPEVKDWRACKLENNCFAQYVSIDQQSRLVVLGNVAPLLFKNLGYKGWRSRWVLNKISDVFTEKQIEEKGLKGKEDWVVQRYTYMTQQEWENEEEKNGQNAVLTENTVMWDKEESNLEVLKKEQAAEKGFDLKVFGSSEIPPPPKGPAPAQAQWKKGSFLEVFSKSERRWFKGEVKEVFTDEEGEWLRIDYKTPKEMRRKDISRWSKRIRPLGKGFGPSESQPQQEVAPPQQEVAPPRKGQRLQEPVKSLTARKDWKEGSKLEIYSFSKKVWLTGEVMEVMKDYAGDFLKVSYKNPDGSKSEPELHGRYSNQIRPTKELHTAHSSF